MSKKRRLSHVDLSIWPTTSLPDINWVQCILCQTDTDQPLIQPTESGYISLIDHLREFAKLDALPRTVRLQQMDDGSGVLQTFVTHNAKYHKICRNMYDAQKLSRLQQRAEKAQVPSTSGAYTAGASTSGASTSISVTYHLVMLRKLMVGCCCMQSMHLILNTKRL